MAKTELATVTLPYGRQWIDEGDIRAVETVLRSDWLTTGPKVAEFEGELARVTGTMHAVAVNSGTAALHAAMYALGVGPGDEVIVPALTFAASANCILYQGGTPVFADVSPDTLLVDPKSVAQRLSPRTRAIIAVDYAGQACDYETLRAMASNSGCALVADACHSLGGSRHGHPVGSLADLSAFSFHPVKPVTAGEGGAVTTNDPELAARMRVFRNHGITSDHRQRETEGSWFYEMVDLGFNYRLSDIQCALVNSQLAKLEAWTRRRQELAARYDRLLAQVGGVTPLTTCPGVSHAYHLYVVQVHEEIAGFSRAAAFAALRREGIGVNVHYVPVYLHPYYRNRLNTAPGLCPNAEAAYQRILSLPIFPRMQDEDVDRVADALSSTIHLHR